MQQFISKPVTRENGIERIRPDYYQRNCQAGDRPALWFYARLARRWLAPEPVLDFGCGTGSLLRRLRRHLSVADLEQSDYCRSLLSRDLPGAQIFDNLTSLPAGAIAGVMDLYVFEHIPDAALFATLAGLRVCLLPQGRLLCVMTDAAGRGRQLKGERWRGLATQPMST